MKETIEDIRRKISDSIYQNEEHVRVCVVARLLQKLGWDIWNPREVCAEYAPNPNEDSKRVDFALFLPNRSPGAFVEVKSVGRIRQELEQSEQQLRDYNKNLTAVFSILTDGRTWRLYLSRAGGDFRRKLFQVVDLLEDELEDIEGHFGTFLAKENVVSGSAESEAQNYLRLGEKQRTMDDSLSQARRNINQPPYPNLPDALVKQVLDNGFEISVDEAIEFINSAPARPVPERLLPVATEPPRPGPRDGGTVADRGFAPLETERLAFPPDRPPSLRHTKLEQARIYDKQSDGWNGLLQAAIVVASEHGMTIQQIRNEGRVNLEQGLRTDCGFQPLREIGLSVQNMQSDRCYMSAYLLAKKMRIELEVQFRWRDNDGAQHPGERGVIHYVP